MGQPHTGPRCSIHRNEANTTTYNSNFPTQQSQKVTLLATRFVHPPSWLTPPTTPTFPRQQAEKSPQNQHVLPCNPKTPPAPVPGCRRARLRCPWAAVEPGRTTSRRAEQSSRRGRLAGGPPPTGTPSSPAAIVAGCKAQPGAPAATCAAARDTQTHRTLARALSPGLVHRRKRPPL